MSEIVIENIKAIKRLVIPVPEAGGLVEVRGTHGLGKSTAADAIQRTLRQDGRLELRDGAERGSVSIGGAVARVTRGKTLHGGELLVEHIEGRFSLSDLIDPGLKDPERADASRVKALVELSGAKADASLFDGLSPEVDPTKIKADDLIQLSSKLKAELELKARDAEAAAGNALDKAKRESPPEGAVIAGAIDPKTLTDQQREAAAKLNQLLGQDKAAETAAAKHADVTAKLAAIDRDELATTLEAAETAALRAVTQHTATANTVAEYRALLAAAIEAEKAAGQANVLASRDLDAARAALKAADDLKASLESTAPPRVNPDELTAAKNSVSNLEWQITLNAQITRDAVQAAKAAEFFGEHDRLSKRAESLRKAAARIDEILSGVVAGMGCRLRVKNGRIVLDTHRGEELFGDLSHGERTLEAIDVAFSVLPRGAILVIEQEIYASLNDADKLKIREQSIAGNVLTLGEVVTEDAELVVVEVAAA